MGSGHQQGSRDATPFVDQKVVGATGGRGVHDLQAASGFAQGALQFGRGKAELRAGAEQEDAIVQRGQVFEVGTRERGEVGLRPFRDQAVGQHKDVPGVAHRIDADITIAVGGKCVQAHRLVELDFHKLRCVGR